MTAITGVSSKATSIPKFAMIPKCKASFASQMYVIQQLILQAAKLLQPTNKAWATTQNVSNSIFGKQKILLFTHNLEIEGAPKCMLQLAMYLKRHNVDISLISPRTGALHDTYRVLGVPVEIRPEFLFHGNERSIINRYGSPHDPRSKYKPSRKNCDAYCHKLCSEYDVIVANTNEAMLFVHDLFYCVDKILWWVHESNWDVYQHHYRHQGQLLQAVPALCSSHSVR